MPQRQDIPRPAAVTAPLDGAPVFHIALEPMPSSVPPAVRLKRVLKFAQRVCELRCISVKDEHAKGSNHD